MFEKEAEEYATKKIGDFKPIQEDKETEWLSCCEDFQNGVNFAYNKANEWHYVKDGVYPTDEKDVDVLYQDCDKINVYNCVYDTHAKNWLYYNLDDMVLELFPFNVIAWKEIVLPELNI